MLVQFEKLMPDKEGDGAVILLSILVIVIVLFDPSIKVFASCSLFVSLSAIYPCAAVSDFQPPNRFKLIKSTPLSDIQVAEVLLIAWLVNVFGIWQVQELSDHFRVLSNHVDSDWLPSVLAAFVV